MFIELIRYRSSPYKQHLHTLPLIHTVILLQYITGAIVASFSNVRL